MKKIVQSCLLVFLIFAYYITSSFCGQSEPDKNKIENLRAFAKLYGYVKYFHPSDEASEIDWDKFALYGTERVLKAKTPEELKSCLLDLFLPIAPTMQLLSPGENPKPYKNPEKTDGLLSVAWQHLGVGVTSDSIYKSRRTNRIPPGDFSDSISNYISMKQFNYKKIKLSARMKAEVQGKWNFGDLRLAFVSAETYRTIASKSLKDRQVKENEWRLYEIELDTPSLPVESINIKIDVCMSGTGKVWVDDLKLTAFNLSGKEEDITIENPGFEELIEMGYPKKWIYGFSFSHIFRPTELDSYEGKSSMMIMNFPGRIPESLFDYMPKPGEFIQKDIGAGLRCMIPIFLWSDENHTLGSQPGNALTELKNALSKISLEDFSISNESHRAADIVIAWNVFQHFYPYFDIVKTDWDNVLTESFKRALESKNEKEYLKALNWMIAQLGDGHGMAYRLVGNQNSFASFWAEWVEGKLVVTASGEPEKFRKGDIILEINDKPTEKYYQEESQYMSGTDRWKRYRFALSALIAGKEGKETKLQLDRDGAIIDAVVVYNNSYEPQNREIEAITELEKDIWYVDLNRAAWDQIEPKIENIINSKGVIFDLRGYPRDMKVLDYLSDVPMWSEIWKIPQIIYPDRENLENWDETGRWWIQPAKKKIKGKIIFLTNAKAISMAETIMGIIEYYKVGEIIGEPTAGTNGNVNPFTLPGKYQISWTGMRVEKHDRSQHHLIGIQPTIPCSKTIKGVREGKDEQLEKALKVIKSSQKSKEIKK